jgi:hypothetical protein
MLVLYLPVLCCPVQEEALQRDDHSSRKPYRAEPKYYNELQARSKLTRIKNASWFVAHKQTFVIIAVDILSCTDSRLRKLFIQVIQCGFEVFLLGNLICSYVN